MSETFEKINKEEIEGKIKTLESDLAYGNDLKENERVYKRLLEKSDPEKHKLNIKRAQQKLEDIENIKKLRAKLQEISGEEKSETKEKESDLTPESEKETTQENPTQETKPTEQEQINELRRKMKEEENEPETTEGIEVEPLPEFVWTKEVALTKKEDGIDAEEEIGTVNFEIGGEPAKIGIYEDCWEWGKKPSRARKIFLGAKQKPVKLENSYWDVNYEFSSYILHYYENKIQEFKENFPEKEGVFIKKEDALAYANEMKIAMAKLKNEIEKDMKKREKEKEKERAQQEKERNEKIWQEIKEGNYDNVLFMTNITKEVAEILAEKYKGKTEGLEENLSVGIATLSPEIAKILAKYEGTLTFFEINSLSIETAEAFVDFKGKYISFRKIRNITPELAKIFSKYQQNIFLNDLETLTDETLEALAPFKKTVFAGNEELEQKIKTVQEKYREEHKKLIS